MRARRSDSHYKLIAAAALMVTSSVAFASYYFPAQQIASMESALKAKADSYSAMLSTQARSAVAFEDRETAREVLSSLSSDPEVVSVYLYDAHGGALYAAGPESDWHQKARLGVAAPKSFHFRDRMAAVAPVVSLEGPTGTLIIELSMDDVHGRANGIRSMALIIGALAMLFGAAAAYLSRRLARASHEMYVLLDSADQGFLNMSPRGILAEQRSAFARRIVGPHRPNQHFGDALAALDADAGEYFKLGWDEVMAGNLPLELCLEQLPRKFMAQDRTYRIEYKPASSGSKLEQVFVVITNITAELARERAEHAERDLLQLIKRITIDRRGVSAFLAEAEELVGRIGASNRERQQRDLHTLKGNASSVGLNSLATLCHDLEESLALEGGSLCPVKLHRLEQAWFELREKTRFLEDRSAEEIAELRAEDVERLERAVSSGSLDEVGKIVAALHLEPVKMPMERLSDQARRLSDRLGKQIRVSVDSNDIRLDAKSWRPFWSAMVHAVRNAVDHGIESPDERTRAGKPAQGRLHFSAEIGADELRLELVDDGRGIDWERVRREANALNVSSETSTDLMEALFFQGLSTKDETTDISGRGVGLASLRDECVSRGGSVEITSQPGAGTRIVCRFPHPQDRSRAVESSVHEDRAPRRRGDLVQLQLGPAAGSGSWRASRASQDAAGRDRR